jgi:hypothetical protein
MDEEMRRSYLGKRQTLTSTRVGDPANLVESSPLGHMVATPVRSAKLATTESRSPAQRAESLIPQFRLATIRWPNGSRSTVAAVSRSRFGLSAKHRSPLRKPAARWRGPSGVHRQPVNALIPMACSSSPSRALGLDAPQARVAPRRTSRLALPAPEKGLELTCLSTVAHSFSVCLTDRASAAATGRLSHYPMFLTSEAPASSMRLLGGFSNPICVYRVQKPTAPSPHRTAPQRPAPQGHLGSEDSGCIQ